MKIAIIGHKGFLGSRLMKAIPGAVGIGRGELDKLNDDWDWVINCATTYKSLNDTKIIRDNLEPAYEVMYSCLGGKINKIIHFSTIMQGYENDIYTRSKMASHKLLTLCGSALHNILLGDVYDPDDTSRRKFIDSFLSGERKLELGDYESKCYLYPISYKTIVKFVRMIVDGELTFRSYFLYGCIPLKDNRIRFWGHMDDRMATHQANMAFLEDLGLDSIKQEE